MRQYNASIFLLSALRSSYHRQSSRFGRAPEAHPLIRFGKRAPDSAPLIRYALLPSLGFAFFKTSFNVIYPRFGRDPEASPLIRFGKRSPAAPLIRLVISSLAQRLHFG
ncbi:unnamed protein product [Haemonchus placei]|uniref:Uncharacterized protein n=1 Tax=Haemonchus placei TaxID=6290 RepID=A0A0N4WHN2_HAEPC|nr:unnamed protein product [Haemonchus placei]